MAGTRKRNPEIMKQISSFVEEYFFEYHGSPSMQKIATAIGTSKSTAYYYINEMAEKSVTPLNLAYFYTSRAYSRPPAFLPDIETKI